MSAGSGRRRRSRRTDRPHRSIARTAPLPHADRRHASAAASRRRHPLVEPRMKLVYARRVVRLLSPKSGRPVRFVRYSRGLFAAVLPAVAIASTTQAFRHTYPFYRLANRSYADLVIWEALYALQFLSLEFFFRGFILHGLRPALGANAVFVMLVPYCMIHYHKPLRETLGAIGAGLILGTLAMRTRSIWGSVLLHIGVATTMDVLALRGCPPIGGAACH
ncbi:MAG: CPBP family intramembrane metalloprotease [Deltaproteobacteria bacterium]|nr:MAG: CPBP family intramembrane metalloprotease [Deltaproteobacteria bacterium]